MRRIVLISVALCFFLSGAAGLVYEIVWLRMLGLVFGHTVFALTTVLAAFMAGLALGASLFGRLGDRGSRPLRLYGLLEAAIGLYALLVTPLLAVAERFYVWVYRSLDFSLPALVVAQFAMAFAILVIPTALMGGTLPVMSRFFVRRLEGVGRGVADLYALNTFGAVLGSAAAGFVLLPALGVTLTTTLAAAANLAIGAWALVADRLLTNAAPARAEPAPAVAPPAAPFTGPEPRPRALRIVLLGAALSGAAAMVYEITWTRALTLVVGSSIYAFSAMLTTFLVGLGLGSFLFARIWGRRGVGASVFAWLEIAAGLTALALIPTFDRMPGAVLEIMRRLSPSPEAALLSQFVASFLAMLVPTTLLGAALPCAIAISGRSLARLGHDVGRVWAANTAGTIVGALAGGFALVPWLGLQASMVAATAVNVTTGLAVLAVTPGRRPSWRWAAAVPCAVLFVAGVVWLPRWDPRVMVAGATIYAQKFTGATDPAALLREHAASRRLLFHREGMNSTVSVDRTGTVTSLRIDGKVDASTGVDMATQLVLGHLPVFLHARPERVLVVGLGSGVTAGALAQHAVVRRIDVVELEPAVVEASRVFVRENRGVLDDPRVRVVIGDARNFILASADRYDAIVSEPSNPWMAGVANLFSREFYRLARARLRAGGLMVQWLHAYSLFPRELRMVVATFRRAFPHSTLWRTVRGDYLLVGTATPLTVDHALVAGRIAASPGVQEDMARLYLASPLDVLTLFALDETALARFAEGAPENTDDRPRLEFAAPLALYAETTDLNARLLRQARVVELPALANLPPGALDARRTRFAWLAWARGEREEALAQLRRAPAPGPHDVAAGLERAKLLFALGEIAEAGESFARLAERATGDPVIASYLTATPILRRMGTGATLVEQAQTRRGEPNPVEAHNNLGVYLTRLGVQLREPAFIRLAIDTLESIGRIEPEVYAILANLANAYFEVGRLDDAARAYREVVARTPRLPEARFNLGLVYEKQGMIDLARHEFEAAAILDPRWTLPRMGLARLAAAPASDGAAPPTKERAP